MEINRTASEGARDERPQAAARDLVSSRDETRLFENLRLPIGEPRVRAIRFLAEEPGLYKSVENGFAQRRLHTAQPLCLGEREP